MIPSNENHFIISKKRKSMSPSHFEIAEAEWHCGPSNRVIVHDQRFQNTSPTTSEFEVSTTIADDDVFDWIDSNM
jgi:hypothetical protein